MEKHEKVKITGTSHYSDNIITLMFENSEYFLSNKELLDLYDDGDDIPEYVSSAMHVDLIPEPDNKYDSNAVRCDIEGVKVGYVKRGSCSHIKNLLSSPNFKHIMIDKFIYGNVKHVYSDDYGKTHIEKREYENPVVHLLITSEVPLESIEVSSQAKGQAPETAKKIIQKRHLIILISLIIISLSLFFIIPSLGIISTIITIIYAYKRLK